MKSNLTKIIISLTLVLVLSGTVISDTYDENLRQFDKANLMYENKNYKQAIVLYDSILTTQMESPAVYHNLGNAYFKEGNLGLAILNYMKAKRLAPDDEEILHNLEFARQFSRIKMEGVELNPVRSMMLSMVDNYHLNHLAWLASLFFIIFMTILILRFGIGFTGSWVKASIVISLCLLIVGVSLTSFKYRYDYLNRKGVIIEEDSPVYTGASDQSDIELDAAPGLVVEIVSENSGFYNVLFENKRKGWIKKELVAEL